MQRAGWGVFGWISLGIGTAGSGLGGHSWFMAEDASIEVKLLSLKGALQ